jgi:V8-like Glu-specific endopeptidase
MDCRLFLFFLGGDMQRSLLSLMVLTIFFIASCSEEKDPIANSTVNILANSDGLACHAVVLSEGIYLTAAHCVESGYRKLKINSKTKSNYKIHIHPEWDAKIVKNDIALIVFEKHSKTLDIKFFESELQEGDQIKSVLAYKSNKIKTYHTVSHLKGGRIYTTDNSRVDRMCKGDSGSPVYYEIGGDHYLVGVASGISGPISRNCNDGGYSVYASIFEYENWVREVIEESAN